MANSIGVLGAGAWGSAISQVLGLSHNQVLLFTRDKNKAQEINKTHKNPDFLPDITLSSNIIATHDIEEIGKNCKTIFCVTPSHSNTQVAATLNPYLTEDHTVVLCSKGFRESDGALMSDVWQETAPALKYIAVLSGPSFAIEVAQKKPTAITLAAKNKETLLRIGELFKENYFRLYYSSDMVGVQVGGATKNIIAIATGISDALELGDNCRAAIICRGIVEMSRYARTLGAQQETLYGLSGMGDVFLTSTSSLSRNYRFGKRMGSGLSLKQATTAEKSTIEGTYASRIVATQAISHGIELSLITAVDGILQGDLTPQRAVEYLLDRPRIEEFDEHLS